ncbi:class II aldolase/adducin family protein [Zavarzinia sp. CC-PAN008]|uniref:class II aldolase/adducin family protein n=1 Tax=Zavarzinia sp. CC-PAN008 TaxID=3243332 RepID=UPI003F74456A
MNIRVMPPEPAEAVASELSDDAVWQLRVDLAAAFRLAVKFDWHESVGNHFSAAVSADGKKFLLNRKWQHFATIRASDLMLLDADDHTTMTRPDAPDPSAWTIHGTIHRRQPRARVILHCHPPYATALAGLKDPEMKPIDQNTARFYRSLGIDRDFGGIANDADEGERLAGVLGNYSELMMGNHGVTTIAPTVAEAFEALYFLERAAKTLMLAYASGQPLNIMPADIAEKTAAGWEPYKEQAHPHFDYLKSTLDKDDPSYRD